MAEGVERRGGAQQQGRPPQPGMNRQHGWIHSRPFEWSVRRASSPGANPHHRPAPPAEHRRGDHRYASPREEDGPEQQHQQRHDQRIDDDGPSPDRREERRASDRPGHQHQPQLRSRRRPWTQGRRVQTGQRLEEQPCAAERVAAQEDPAHHHDREEVDVTQRHRQSLHGRFDTSPFQGDQRGVIETPDDERPPDAVPDTAQQDDERLAAGGGRTDRGRRHARRRRTHETMRTDRDASAARTRRPSLRRRASGNSRAGAGRASVRVRSPCRNSRRTRSTSAT